jgi:hypothetical protein
MANQLSLTAEELGLIELALGETITVLKNRFEEEVEYVHPANKYEMLYDKLSNWFDTLPASTIVLSAEKDSSAYC